MVPILEVIVDGLLHESRFTTGETMCGLSSTLDGLWEDYVLTKGATAYQQIRECTHWLTEGTIVSVDPSIGSTSSQPGWAVYRAGELLAVGLIEIDPSLTVWERLRKLVHGMRKLYKEWDPDVLVYEDIPSQRHGGGNANSHASLLKAVGAILSVSGPRYYVGLHPLSWKRMVRADYVKSDERDALEIGWIAIQEARRIYEQDPPRSYGKPARKVRGSSKAS